MGTWFSLGIAAVVALPLLAIGLFVERLAKRA